MLILWIIGLIFHLHYSSLWIQAPPGFIGEVPISIQLLFWIIRFMLM